MKTTTLAVILTALTASLCLAQDIGSPEARGLTPVIATTWPNTNAWNNGLVEAESVAIAANGNVFFGWEDDGPGINDYQGVWTMYNSSGVLLTPQTEKTNRSLQRVASYQTNTSPFMSSFRTDDTPVWGQPCGWAAHLRANRFGNGVAFGTMTWTIGWEVPEFYNINMNDSGLACGGATNDACIDSCNDEAAWQLLNNDGTPLRPGPINGITNSGILMFSDEECQPAGDVRVGGLEYLANGNIVIVGDSRKAYDANTRFGLLNGSGNRSVVYKIVTPGGDVVMPIALVNSDTMNRAEIRYGTAVTPGGFAVRYQDRVVNRGIVRLFGNDGTPTGPGIDLQTVTGDARAGQNGGGGLGSAVFNSNAKDAYLLVTGGSGTTGGPYIVVLNTNGTVRWNRQVADASDPIGNSANRDVGGAIAADGRVLALWTSPLTNTVTGKTNRWVQGRLFSPSGCPLGARFVVSEYESPTNALDVLNMTLPPQSPHAAWRGNLIAINWRSQSPPFNPLSPTEANRTLGARIFTAPADVAPTPPSGLAIAQSGSDVTISWSGDGVLESADGTAGPWTPIPGCSPYTTAASSAMKLYRVKLSW